MLQIDGCARTVVFANRVNRGRIAKATRIFRICLIIYRTNGDAIKELPLQVELGIAANRRFWKWRGLDQEEPMEVNCSNVFCDGMVELIGWDNVQNRNFRNDIRVIQRHAMSNSSATIMPGDCKSSESQTAHQLHHVMRHGTFGVAEMIFAICRFAAVAVYPPPLASIHTGAPRLDLLQLVPL